MLSNIFSLLIALLSQLPLLIALFVIFILLNILDGHSTWQVIKPNHYSRERNPLARWIFRKLGIPRGIVVFKVVLLLILAAAFAWYAAYDTLILNVILIVADIVFLLVVIHNYRVSRNLGVPTPFDKR